MLRPFIVKVSVLGYFPLHIKIYIRIIRSPICSQRTPHRAFIVVSLLFTDEEIHIIKDVIINMKLK